MSWVADVFPRRPAEWAATGDAPEPIAAPISTRSRFSRSWPYGVYTAGLGAVAMPLPM
jgi:hypothetical protein